MNVPCPVHFVAIDDCTDACLRPVARQVLLMVELHDYWNSLEWRQQFRKYKRFFATHHPVRIAA